MSVEANLAPKKKSLEQPPRLKKAAVKEMVAEGLARNSPDGIYSQILLAYNEAKMTRISAGKLSRFSRENPFATEERRLKKLLDDAERFLEGNVPMHMFQKDTGGKERKKPITKEGITVFLNDLRSQAHFALPEVAEDEPLPHEFGVVTPVVQMRADSQKFYGSGLTLNKRPIKKLSDIYEIATGDELAEKAKVETEESKTTETAPPQEVETSPVESAPSNLPESAPEKLPVFQSFASSVRSAQERAPILRASKASGRHTGPLMSDEAYEEMERYYNENMSRGIAAFNEHRKGQVAARLEASKVSASKKKNPVGALLAGALVALGLGGTALGVKTMAEKHAPTNSASATFDPSLAGKFSDLTGPDMRTPTTIQQQADRDRVNPISSDVPPLPASSAEQER